MPSKYRAKIINLMGGPGCGKTTIAAGVFARLKSKGINVEYVQEYAKKLVWLERWDDLNNQYSVSRKQYDVLKAIANKVDFIITDGPLAHGFYYIKHNKNNISSKKKTSKSLHEWIDEFNNENYFLTRGDHPYETEGRYQNEKEAREVDEHMKKILKEEGVKFKIYTSNDDTSDIITEEIINLN